jgi:hypothetical protein
MTADECNARALKCAANAAEADNPALSMEFMTMAAQWRAMAVRDIFLGQIAVPMDALSALKAMPILPDFSR